jgi:hypothetical protein
MRRGPRAQHHQHRGWRVLLALASRARAIHRHHGRSTWLRSTPTRNRGSAGVCSAGYGRRTGQRRVGHQRPHRRWLAAHLSCSRCAVVPKRARAGLFYGDLRPRAASTRRNKNIGRLRQHRHFCSLLSCCSPRTRPHSRLRSRSVRHRRNPPVTQPLCLSTRVCTCCPTD